MPLRETGPGPLLFRGQKPAPTLLSVAQHPHPINCKLPPSRQGSRDERRAACLPNLSLSRRQSPTGSVCPRATLPPDPLHCGVPISSVAAGKLTYLAGRRPRSRLATGERPPLQVSDSGSGMGATARARAGSYAVSFTASSVLTSADYLHQVCCPGDCAVRITVFAGCWLVEVHGGQPPWQPDEHEVPGRAQRTYPAHDHERVA